MKIAVDTCILSNIFTEKDTSSKLIDCFMQNQNMKIIIAPDVFEELVDTENKAVKKILLNGIEKLLSSDLRRVIIPQRVGNQIKNEIYNNDRKLLHVDYSEKISIKSRLDAIIANNYELNEPILKWFKRDMFIKDKELQNLISNQEINEYLQSYKGPIQNHWILEVLKFSRSKMRSRFLKPMNFKTTTSYIALVDFITLGACQKDASMFYNKKLNPRYGEWVDARIGSIYSKSDVVVTMDDRLSENLSRLKKIGLYEPKILSMTEFYV